MPIKCSVCGSAIKEIFQVPKTKLTGRPMPSEKADCSYYECLKCQFCFTDYMPKADPKEIYDQVYWSKQDSEHYGRLLESFRLITLATKIYPELNLWKAKILDFGCGMGALVKECRDKFSMNLYGHDIIKSPLPDEYFIPDLNSCRTKFDLVISCEVLEHLPKPMETFNLMKSLLEPNGTIAFQTAVYEPTICNKNWWYIGPANGHVSFYSIKTFDYIANILKVQEKLMWNNYPGVQAWHF